MREDGVCVANVYNDSFEGYGHETLDSIRSFGRRRSYHEPITIVGEDLNIDEKAKIAIEYGVLVGFNGRARAGTVTSLAWEWGVYSTTTIRTIYYRFKYGKTIFSQRGCSVSDRIMDVLANQKAVVHILKDRKGRVSGRRLQAAFRDMTGIAVSRSTLVRYLKTLNLKITRRRYSPMLTPTHKMTRSRFGSKYMHENFDCWIDLDEKWCVCFHSCVLLYLT